MKLPLSTFSFLILLGAAQPMLCNPNELGSLDRAIDDIIHRKLSGVIDKKASHIEARLDRSLENGLNNGLNRGSTNTSFKFGGLSFAALSCAFFLFPEVAAYLDSFKNPAPGQIIQPHVWNSRKIAVGLASTIAGLAIAASGDRMTKYLYTPKP